MENKENVIGLFNDSFPPILDGVTLTVQNYAGWLSRNGYRTCVITPWNPVKPEYGAYDIFRYFSLPIASRYPYRYGYPKADPLIWRKLRNTPFSIVHAHCPFSSGRLALYAARQHNVPLVATFHSKYRMDLEHSLPQWMVKRIMKRVMEFFNSADEVWIPQAKVEETVREYGYKGPLTVVQNGTDLAGADFDTILKMKREARHKLGIPSHEMRLLFVGQHILEKGVDKIINMMACLRDLPVKMSFIGTGYAVDDMLRHIARLKLDDRITLNGVISDRELLRTHYAAADLFLFPSLYDNAPLVVREAAVMGTPSVIVAGSTTAEVIDDGVNGFLACNSAESYAAVVRTLYDNRRLLLKVAANASHSLARSWNDVMEEVVQRYTDVIKRYGSKRHK